MTEQHGRDPVSPWRLRTDRRDKIDETLPPLIALVGCDGAGKSTVAGALLAWLGETKPVALCHLGKQTGDYKRALARVPLIGASAESVLKAEGEKVSRGNGAGPFTAVATYCISMRRVRRFKRMLALRRRGVTILADRYPQLAVPGPKMDGPHLVVARARSAVTRFLTAREDRHYRWMTSHVPDLVIRLNVDYETAMRRKPDHNPRGLSRKIELTPLLTFNGAPIVDIDSRLPLDAVLELARDAVAGVLARRPVRFAPTRQASQPSSLPAIG